MKVYIALVLIILSITDAAAQDASTVEGRDEIARRTRFYRDTPIKLFSQTKIKFKLKENEYSRQSPAIFDGIPYLGTMADAAVAIDGFSFKGVYGGENYGKVEGAPTVTDGAVYVGFSSNRIASFDRTNQTLNWEYKTKGSVNTTPLVVDNILLVSDNAGYLYALNSADGSQKWRFNVTGKTNSPAYYRDIIFISSDLQVYALKKSNGDVLWKYIGAGGPLVITDDLVLCRQKNGRLVSLDLTTGNKVYEYTGTIRDVKSEMAYAGNILLIPNVNELIAIDARAGKNALWTKSFSRAFAGSPIIVGDVIYVPCIDWNLYALDLNTGAELDKIDIGFAPEGSPAFGGGKLYCVNKETLWTIESQSTSSQSTDNSFTSNLHDAAEYGKIDAVKDFIESKYDDINKLNSTGKSPLSLASEWGHTEVVGYLLSKGASVDLPDSSGRSPLMYAVWYNHPEVTRLLVKAGANVNKKDNKGISALAHGAMENSVNACMIILDAGAKVNSLDNFNRDALIHTAWEGKDDMVKILLDRGATIDQQDNEGETALMKAVQFEKHSTVRILLERGANRSLKNNNGKTALDIAKEKNLQVMIDILSQ
jgi:ankyrin repeat protein